MKKIYTLTAVIFASGLAFSQVNNSQNKWQGAMYGAPEKVSYKLGTLPTDKQEFTGNGAKTKPSGVSNRAADHSAFITLGETYYDLQSNAAMPHRLVKHPNGNISATWTTASSDAAGFPVAAVDDTQLRSGGSRFWCGPQAYLDATRFCSGGELEEHAHQNGPGCGN